MKRLDVVSLGDLILNFVYKDTGREGFNLYERQPAGATANLLSQLVKLGGTGGLITTVGNDDHGSFLYEYAKQTGIDVSNVCKSNDVATRMMFVHFDEKNDRYFLNYHSRRTDVETRLSDVNIDMMRGCKAFTMPLVFYYRNKPIYETCKNMLKLAKEQGSLVGIDCNWRGDQHTPEELTAICDAAMNSDVVKLTDVELLHYFGENDILKGSERILSGNTKLVAVTLGENGCLLRNQNGYVYQPAFAVDVVDTTGAGDSFMGALLYQVTRPGFCIDELKADDLAAMAEFLNACSSGSTSRRGSMSAMSTMDETRWIIENVSKKAPAYSF